MAKKPAPQSEGNELALFPNLNLPTVTAIAEEMNASFKTMYTRLEEDIAKLPTDMSDPKNRQAVASYAYRISRTKTALDEAATNVSGDAKKIVDAVNAERAARAEAERRAKEAEEEAKRRAIEEEEARKAAAARAEEEAKRREAAAAEAERQRLAKLAAEKEESDRARAADIANRKKINSEAVAGLMKSCGLPEADAQAIVIAVFKGQVPHISISY